MEDKVPVLWFGQWPEYAHQTARVLLWKTEFRFGLWPVAHFKSEGLVERAEHKIWQIACLLFLFAAGCAAG